MLSRPSLDTVEPQHIWRLRPVLAVENWVHAIQTYPLGGYHAKFGSVFFESNGVRVK